MIELNFSIHEPQQEIHNSLARFKVIAAGRRFGKSWLAAIELLVMGLEETNRYGYNVHNKEVYYIAPTFEQARRIIWPLLKDLGKDVIAKSHENNGVLTLINGRRISIKGADNPDSLRGVGLSFVVLDEYADMKESVWSAIIRPALQDVKGSAMFIGTPKGKNHFYKLWMQAKHSTVVDMLGNRIWAAFQYTTHQNPTLDKEEITLATGDLSKALAKQELDASFISAGGAVFKEEWWKFRKTPFDYGEWYVAVDPAGFMTQENLLHKSKLSSRDECVIVTVQVSPDGWFVDNIDHGYWDVRETALRILKAATDCRARVTGIERGMAKNAIMPYLTDEMSRIRRWINVEDLNHGGRSKGDRIQWALQGRLEQGRIFLREDAPWIEGLIDQALDFPDPLSHDDKIDALAYVDQISRTVYNIDVDLEEWKPLDAVAGY